MKPALHLVAAALTLLSSAAFAADGPTIVGTTCLNSHDGMWAESVQGLNTMFGGALQFTADRAAGTVMIEGPRDARPNAVTMLRSIDAVACGRAVVTYRVLHLPVGADLTPAVAKATAAGAALSPGGGILTVPSSAVGEIFSADLAAMPGAVTLLDVNASLLHNRPQAFATTTEGASVQVEMASIVNDDGEALLQASTIASWKQGGITKRISSPNAHRLRPGQGDILMNYDSQFGHTVIMLAVSRAIH